MATEAAGGAGSNRPRPMLLVLLAVVVGVFLWMRLGGSADPGVAPSNRTAPQTAAAQRPGRGPVDPSTLDVRLESLTDERPDVGGAERNPFRFQMKPPPPDPAVPRQGGESQPFEPAVSEPAGPPPPPPITVKFIGTLDLPSGITQAVFVECTSGRRTASATEGETVMGLYRLVKIGLQSVVIEHLDGTGRTTLPKTGQECVR